VIAEAYRTIRTGVLLSSADNPPQVILFTSGSAGEGKTVTAVNQALTLAQAGARVLLIDADIRKPRLHKLFNLSNGHGLSTYLTGQSDLERIIYEVAPNGNGTDGEVAGVACKLYVLPSGPLPPNPAELVGSQRMRETLKTLREHFDYIVIDTPPVLPVTDAVLLATMSDGVVLVVRGQDTPTDVAVKSRDRLEYVRAKILGVVLNDVDVTSGDYHHYHRYYYSYYADTAHLEA
jgi:capsular exopolysaccharide synthesis family protein